jgi:hypothetical protein
MIVWGGCGLWVLLVGNWVCDYLEMPHSFLISEPTIEAECFFANGQEFVKYAQNSHFDL